MQVRGIDIFDRSEPLTPPVLAAVAAGGAVGAAGRWFVAWVLAAVAGPHTAGSWSWATLIVNIVGSLAIGIAARGWRRDSIHWAFTVTGVLGGFTTYSTFAVELDDMADAGRLPLAIAYAAATIVGGVAAVVIAGTREEEVGPR